MNGLQLFNLCKSFGAFRVIDGLSLTFQPGTVSAIVGDNGAGKSTLLKLLSGVHRPDAGEIALGGENISRCSPQFHRDAGIEMVFQDFALARNHDIASNLFIGRELTNYAILKRKLMSARARAVLDELAIDIPRLCTPVGHLSGGQQQAVAIARALMFNPKVLLLDEPTAALAAREVQKVIDLVLAQKKAGRIIIFVSHRLNDVFAVADRILVMKRGKIFSDDPASAVDIAATVQRIVT